MLKRVITADRYALADSISAPSESAQERLLNDVFRFGDAPEHPVRDREHQRAQTLESIACLHVQPPGDCHLRSLRGRSGRLPRRVLRLEIVEPVSEAVAPALPGRLPAELPLRLRVRGAADLRHQRDGNLACRE